MTLGRTSRVRRWQGRGRMAALIGCLIAVVALSAVAVARVSGGSLGFLRWRSQGNESVVDLIRHQHWQLAGVSMRGDALRVTSANVAIVRQDGSPGQANPPVNLYGMRLQVRGDFSVTAELTDVADGAEVALYGTPPLIEDELRAELGTLTMTIKGGTLDVVVADQRGGRQAEAARYMIDSTSRHTLEVADRAGRLSFRVDDKALASIPDRDVFKTGEVWFGLTAPSGGAFTVSSLRAQGENGGAVHAIDTRQQTLGQASDGLAQLAQRARPGFLLGTSVALGPMVADPTYARILGNFNAVTTENVGKFQTIHPLPGNDPNAYNFNDMDAVVALARQANMQVQGHALVFGEANPAWVQELARQHPDRLRQVMIDHITSVVSHYKGQVAGWDVVNEPLADYDTVPGQYGLRQNIWYEAMGPDYIAVALRAAHAADPQASLWINEFGLEFDDERFATMVDLVRRLQAQSVPLTGIGFQAHIDDGDTINNDTHVDTNVLAGRIATLKALGLKVRFSELDVSNESEYPVFRDVTKVCLAEASCVGVTFWGATDKYSSAGGLDGKGIFSPGLGLLWDSNERALPPVTSIKEYLRQITL